MSKETSLTFYGDVYLPRPFKCAFDPGNFVFNLEYSIGTEGVPECSSVNLVADKNYIFKTFNRDPAAVCIANNHIMDFGKDRFDSTKRELDSCGYKYFGAGTSADNFNNPRILDLNNTKVALLGYVCESTSPVFSNGGKPGPAKLEISAVKADIKKAVETGAVRVVVNVHWGAENVPLPKPEDVMLARQFIDAGADLVIGHHAHCIQTIEKYHGKYIFYGLGNCIFPDVRVDVISKSKSGIEKEPYTYRQKPWNKKSLSVTYNPVDNSVVAKELNFDKGSLKVIKVIRLPEGESLLISGVYGSIFRYAFVYFKIKVAIFSFFQKPKLPSIRHFKIILSWCKATIYK